MNLIKRMKRHGLNKLLVFEQIFSDIEKEAREDGDPRVDNEGGVAEQLQAVREAIQELREEQGIPIPPVTVGMKTLILKAQRGIDIKE